jgi:hypothetical protein
MLVGIWRIKKEGRKEGSERVNVDEARKLWDQRS